MIASTTELAQMNPEIFKCILSTFKNKTKKNEYRARGEAEAKKNQTNNPVGIKKKKVLKEGVDGLRTRIVDSGNTAYSSASN